MVEAAMEVEVVVGPREFHRSPVEAVVQRREDDMLACGKRPGLQFEAGVWIRVDAKRTAIDAEIAAQSHAIHDEPGILYRSGEGELAPVEGSPAL